MLSWSWGDCLPLIPKLMSPSCPPRHTHTCTNIFICLCLIYMDEGERSGGEGSARWRSSSFTSVREALEESRRRGRGGQNKHGGGSESGFAFVWLLVISQEFITAWELSLFASSVCCAAIKCILVGTNLHLHSSNPGCRRFGGQKHTGEFCFNTRSCWSNTQTCTVNHSKRIIPMCFPHELTSGMRQTAFNSIKLSAPLLGPSVLSIVLLLGSSLADR